MHELHWLAPLPPGVSILQAGQKTVYRLPGEPLRWCRVWYVGTQPVLYECYEGPD